VTLRVAAPHGWAPARLAFAEAAATAAAGAWSSPCSAAAVRIAEADPARLGAERDGVNTISFLQDRWCRAGRWRNGCYPSSELAVTTVYLSPTRDPGRAAAIAEVDVEINAVDYDWFGDSPDKRVPPTDLTALVSHELGHVFGLAHTAPSASRRLAAGTIMTEAVHEGGGGPRRPSPLDKKALCALYPARAQRQPVAPVGR
jgi:hypothetical protein